MKGEGAFIQVCVREDEISVYIKLQLNHLASPGDSGAR